MINKTMTAISAVLSLVFLSGPSHASVGFQNTGTPLRDREISKPEPFSQRAKPQIPFATASLPKNPLRLAHAILVKAMPAKESVVSDALDEVFLTFNEGVGSEYLALAVINADGKRVDQHDARLDFTDRSHLRASLSKLVPGRYTVRYRVLSADGHVVSGKYFFQVK
jgi:methionine-rich copper-binding protein CopC